MIRISRDFWVAALLLFLPSGVLNAAEPAHPKPIKLPFAYKAMESTPVVFQGRPILITNYRDDTKVNTDGYVDSMYSYATDLQTGK